MSLKCQTNVNDNLVGPETKNSNGNIQRCNLPNRRHVLFNFLSVLIIVSLAIYILTTRFTDEKNESDITNLICFSCEFISSSTNQSLMLLKEEKRFCTQSSEGYKMQATLVSGGHSRSSRSASHLQEAEHNHTIPDVRNSTSVAGHLYLNIKNCSLPNNVLLWTINRTHSFVTSGLNYSESTGIMTVIKPGIYYIYSQLIFNTHSELLNSKRYDQLYQQIMLKRNKESSLMLWKQNVNSSREFMPSSLGGNFRLKENDKIYVKASDPQFLYKLLRANFFGLHHV